MSYRDRTKDELQEELRDRDLAVSGTKDELIDRLEQDDAGDGNGNGASSEGRGASGQDAEEEDRREPRKSTSNGLRPVEAARRAAEQLAELRAREVDGIAGFERVDRGWRVVVELVEVSRVPRSTDVLGAYVVTLDEDGELVDYERRNRYVRAQTGEDEW